MIWNFATRNPRAVGGYDLLEKIADGGMSSIFKGRHQATGRTVAVKLARPELCDNPVLQLRMEQEFRAARDLDHPHLVRGLDFGRHEGSVFMVMEYVEGESLGDRIARVGALPEGEAVGIALQVAGALHQAHEKGLIHRDVKPDNILLGTDGNAKLADLGLVKDVEGGLDLTRPSTGLGTPHFMAPEQFDDARNVDRRCDVYSLGATLYMAVTGKLPFEGRGGCASVLKRKLTGELVPPRTLTPGLSERTDRAIRQAVSLDPAGRPGSCAEFMNRLGASPLVHARSGAPADPGAERRVAVRHFADFAVASRPVGGERNRLWSGRVHNVSSGGLCLMMGRRFEVGAVLCMEAPRGEPGRSFTLLARVVRVQSREAGKWLHGCAFGFPIDDDEIQLISAGQS